VTARYQDVRIAHLETKAVTVPTRPFQTTKRVRAGLGPISSLDFVFVLAHTHSGLVGLGECVPLLGMNGQTAEGARSVIERYLAPRIIGLSPFDLERIVGIVDRAVPGGGTIRAALEMAALDLMGKALNVPLYALLGGKVRDKIPVCSEVSTSDPEGTAVCARALQAQGFNSIKLKVGGDPSSDAACVGSVREAVGPDVEIRVDANQGWTLKEALAFDRETRDRDVAIIEQPLPGFDLQGMASVVSAVRPPVEADESVVSIGDAHRVVSARAADLLNIKVGKNGGIGNCRTVAKFAQSLGMSVVIGTDFSLAVAAAAKLHMACTLPNVFGATEFTELGMFEWDCDSSLLCREPFRIDFHALAVPEGPGLGVSLDEHRLRDFPFRGA